MGNHKFRIAPTFVKKEGEDQGQLEKAVELVRGHVEFSRTNFTYNLPVKVEYLRPEAIIISPIGEDVPTDLCFVMSCTESETTLDKVGVEREGTYRLKGEGLDIYLLSHPK
ncbi:hypothetical protein HOL21_04070 [Candidatus Woesearchaeota archaeon]|jgi:hypothetical protein|nr:hypothetical protein [Candidatus Woesearchaeota archaeon]MBT5397362.1 hypothetical protein [Candidatus Woesearchaeota archaeon]MBT5924742.1 hypothetical protein [Candidatus Woesearchaeota archaeon]MBT6367793.1 hypothetical protein [Candidatus Woesearchaeota archaeon]MBT7762762.1 hypothetical protein [Candidatus Woesearchaeota archaeon]